MLNKVTDFEVVDHGIDGAQYFPGCGVAFSKFDYVQTGTGDSFEEALEDALDSIAQGVENVDVEDLEARIREAGLVPTNSLSVSEEFQAGEEDEDGGNELYYYVSVRYSVPEETPVFRCDRCEAVMINGVFCHETGCTNANKQWDSERELWIAYFDCFECGFPVERGEACDCQSPEVEDSL